MPRLFNGSYRTQSGSTVTIRGEHGGRHDIDFDWLEERACIEAHPAVEDGRLVWSCSCCADGGGAPLAAVLDMQPLASPPAAGEPMVTDADQCYLLWRQARDVNRAGIVGGFHS